MIKRDGQCTYLFCELEGELRLIKRLVSQLGSLTAEEDFAKLGVTRSR